MHAVVRVPLVIESSPLQRSLADLLHKRRAQLLADLQEFGALLFRGFAVNAVSDFDAVVNALSPGRLDYVYRSTPRTPVGDRIFTATEYPPAEEIPLHNENSYQREWPLMLALCCLLPATRGGETPIADMRQVTAAVGERLLAKLEQLRIRYVRHYRPFVDLSWQQVFQTHDREEVARYCAKQAIDHQWLDADTLRTTQVCQGVAHHPATGERLLFNQAHLFHVSRLPAAAAQAVIELYGRDRLPRQAYYGNGDEILPAEIAALRSAYQVAATTFRWQAGDVLLLDNMRFAHGRRPYQGPRKVIAALMESHSERVDS